MATGTIYEAKVALKELLEERDWDNGAPTVTWGQPLKEEDMAPDAVYLGGLDIQNVFRVLGATRSDENYSIPVIVDVRRDGDDEQATEQRAIDLHYEILTLLHANMTLKGAINRITEMRVRVGNAIPAPKQVRSQILIDVSCVGYLTY